MNTEMRDRIAELHGPRTLRKSALNIRGGAGVFETVMAGRGIRTALEIGTYKGCAAAEMARYCDRVVTIDLAVGKLEANGDSWDREAFWRSLGVDNVSLVLVRSDAEKRTFVAGLDFDFAFIDGAHNRAGVELDFALTSRCGRVLFHDADDNGPGKQNDVHEFISSLPKERVEIIDIFALWERKA